MLLGMADADNGLFHLVRRIFPDRKSCEGRHQERDAARLAKLQRRDRILVDEGRLDGRRVRSDGSTIASSPSWMATRRSGSHRAAFSMSIRTPQSMKFSRVAVDLDHAPAGAAEAGIDAEDANRVPGHHPVDSPGLRPRLARFAPQSAQLCGPFRAVTMDSTG